MSKEKMLKLNKYSEDLKAKLASPTPEKHKNGPKEYKRFLENELATVSKKIEVLRFETPAGGKK